VTALLVTDDLLEYEVRSVLASVAVAIHDLAVFAIDGRVRLCGIADSYPQKRRAEELTRAVDGVRQVINQLRIMPS